MVFKFCDHVAYSQHIHWMAVNPITVTKKNETQVEFWWLQNFLSQFLLRASNCSNLPFWFKRTTVHSKKINLLLFNRHVFTYISCDCMWLYEPFCKSHTFCYKNWNVHTVCLKNNTYPEAYDIGNCGMCWKLTWAEPWDRWTIKTC